jgi:hypothetical protein
MPHVSPILRDVGPHGLAVVDFESQTRPLPTFVISSGAGLPVLGQFRGVEKPAFAPHDSIRASLTRRHGNLSGGRFRNPMSPATKRSSFRPLPKFCHSERSGIVRFFGQCREVEEPAFALPRTNSACHPERRSWPRRIYATRSPYPQPHNHKSAGCCWVMQCMAPSPQMKSPE